MDNNLIAQAVGNDPSVLMVCLLGIGVVFAGLFSLVLIVMLMNSVCGAFEKKSSEGTPSEQLPADEASVSSAPIENRDEIVIAACVAIAEVTGTDASALRVVSLKKLN